MLFEIQTEFETAQACLSLLFWLRSLSFNSELRSSLPAEQDHTSLTESFLLGS